MKKFLTIGTSVAVTNLLLFWIVYGILLATWPHTGLSQTLGFSPPPPLSPWRALLLWAFVVLGLRAPFCWTERGQPFRAADGTGLGIELCHLGPVHWLRNLCNRQEISLWRRPTNGLSQ